MCWRENKQSHYICWILASNNNLYSIGMYEFLCLFKNFLHACENSSINKENSYVDLTILNNIIILIVYVYYFYYSL